MDGGHHRGVDQAAVGERQEVEAVVDDVELVGALERGGDVQALGDLGVDRGVLLVPGRSRADAGSAVVAESAVANSVTSWPRATKPSVSSEANSSHGP